MATEQTFQIALNWIFLAEGGLVDDKNDKGGITKYGISLRYLKRKGAAGDINGDGEIDKKDIRQLSQTQASEFYFHDFWLACRCRGMPNDIAIAVFDCAVNQGGSIARRLLQKELHVKQDGIIGPKTLAELAKADTKTLLAHYLAARQMHYRDITMANSEYGIYIRGWTNRLFLLQKFIHEELS